MSEIVDDDMDKYLSVLKQYEEMLEAFSVKTDLIKMMSLSMQEHRDKVDRGKLLDANRQLTAIKTEITALAKVGNSCVTWTNDAILLRLKTEELDNYSSKGKLFYPSTQTYFSTADRTALEAFVNEREGGLEIFGNSLNKSYVGEYLEQNGELPPGVSSYQKQRLNVRSK